LLAEVAKLSPEERESAPHFLPYLSGERTPHNDAAASGVFLGLRHGHRAPHLAYSVIDGVSLGMRDGLDALRRAGNTVDQVQLVGGGSRSTLWAQLLADTLVCKVLVGEDSGVGAALGAARLARLCETGASADQLDSICRKPKTVHTIEPQSDGARLAQRRHAIFRSMYQQLKPVFRAAAL
jgi:xylulokinase